MRVEKRRRVDAGGQGTVWEAFDLDSQTTVAVKDLTPNPASVDPEGDLKRFVREVRYQFELEHENIAKVLAFAQTDDPPWYVLPWAESTLRKELSTWGAMSEDRVVEIFSALLDAMLYAHGEGVLHRDLKPENVLIVGGVPKISDFGLSRRLNSDSTTLTRTTIGMGTLAYSPPEQLVDAHSADERADVFALGKILYEMLTGALPWPRMDMALVPGKFRYIIGKCTADDRERRYSGIDELLREFKLLTAGDSSLQAATDRASSIHDRLKQGDSAAANELLRLLIDHGDDVHLYLKFLPNLGSDSVEALARADADALRTVVHNFDHFAEGGHPFSFTDTLADFMERLFVALPDEGTRELILRRVLILGHDHNRWYLADVFARLASMVCRQQGGALMVAGVLRGEPERIDFVAERLRERPMPEEVLRVLSGS